jgi:hypothetical protein
MNKDDLPKWIFSFFLLTVNIIWAGFCVWITYKAYNELKAVDVLAAAGANVLLGALINWTGNVVQFWFRRAKPQ